MVGVSEVNQSALVNYTPPARKEPGLLASTSWEREGGWPGEWSNRTAAEREGSCGWELKWQEPTRVPKIRVWGLSLHHWGFHDLCTNGRLVPLLRIPSPVNTPFCIFPVHVCMIHERKHTRPNHFALCKARLANEFTCYTWLQLTLILLHNDCLWETLCRLVQ